MTPGVFTAGLTLPSSLGGEPNRTKKKDPSIPATGGWGGSNAVASPTHCTAKPSGQKITPLPATELLMNFLSVLPLKKAAEDHQTPST